MLFQPTRDDTIYIIVSVLKTKNKYEMRMKKPTSLTPNQFVYAINVHVDPAKWKDRILDVTMPEVRPPEIGMAYIDGIDFGEKLGTKVMRRISGK